MNHRSVYISITLVLLLNYGCKGVITETSTRQIDSGTSETSTSSTNRTDMGTSVGSADANTSVGSADANTSVGRTDANTSVRTDARTSETADTSTRNEDSATSETDARSTSRPESGDSKNIVVSRTSGVAPLFVHFDATGTTATGIEHPFHELGYEWNFNDPGAGTWSISGRKKETEVGALAAHVFDNPGTYDVTLTVREPNGNSSIHTVSIKVEDPDLAYAGENTVCVANSNSFTGCPEGALQVDNTNDFTAALSKYAGTAKRVLFRRGDTFESSSSTSLSFSGPSTVGAFGTGERPIIQVSGELVFSLSNESRSLLDDARVMDLDMRASGSSQIVNANGFINNVLFYRIKGTRFRGGGMQLAGESKDHTFYALVECDIEDSGGPAVFAHGNSTAWMGNRFSKSSGSHVVRINYSNRTFVAHNHFDGASENAHELTLRCEYEDLPDCRYWIVSDNKFVGGLSEWTTGFGNGSSGHSEHMNDVIVERNYFLSGSQTYAHINVFADEVTVRNNILDLTGSTVIGMSLKRRGNEGPHVNNWVLNNTCYSSDSASEKVCVRLGTDLSQSTAANNLLAAAKVERKNVADDETGNNKLENNLSIDNPAFANEPPTEPYHFALTEASGDAIDQGSIYGQANGDYALNQRCSDGDGRNGAECDIGAFEYQK